VKNGQLILLLTKRATYHSRHLASYIFLATAAVGVKVSLIHACLQRSDEQKFALQLQQLSVMGFSNQAANIEGKLLLQSVDE